jgi:hypothetical protein
MYIHRNYFFNNILIQPVLPLIYREFIIYRLENNENDVFATLHYGVSNAYNMRSHNYKTFSFNLNLIFVHIL